MDRVSTLVVLLSLILWVSGDLVPGNVTVHLWEGNVTVTWDPPQEIPGGFLYQVQQSNTDSPGVWVNVSHCLQLKATICNIGYLPSDSKFRVRVRVLSELHKVSWSITSYNNVRSSQIYAPTFNLSTTSHSVSIQIHRKHTLEKLFPYDVQYTAQLWPQGQKTKMLTRSYDDELQMTFDSLQSLQVYCVRVMVQSISTDASSISVEQCTKLPLDSVMDNTLIISTILLGIMGVVVLLMLLVWFLKHPQKMPAALKPAVNGWHPMIIGSVQVETVTDKGWVLTNYKSEMKIQTSTKSSEFAEDDQERRESLDSGVSMEQSVRSMTMDEQMVDLQMDSGCESLKGTGDCEHVRTDIDQPFSLIDQGGSSGKEDSGLGLGHHESGSLEGDDSGLSEVVVGDGYRSQSPSSVDVQGDSSMAATPCPYRSGHVTCACSAHEYCMWCRSVKSLILDCQTPTPEADEGNTIISSYLKKSLEQTGHILSMETTEPVFPQSDLNFDESSLLLLSCPLLLQNERKQPNTTKIRCFTLDEVELTVS